MESSCSDKLNFFCSIFEQRAHLDGCQPLMAEFYHDQILSYLFQKNNPLISAPEVDMICDLIEDSWNEFQNFVLEAPLGMIKNIHGLIESFHIDFPLVEKDPVLLND